MKINREGRRNQKTQRVKNKIKCRTRQVEGVKTTCGEGETDQDSETRSHMTYCSIDQSAFLQSTTSHQH